MVHKSGQIFLPFCHKARVWQTDGQTEISSQYRVCITCSAVKTGNHIGLNCSVWLTVNAYLALDMTDFRLGTLDFILPVCIFLNK